MRIAVIDMGTNTFHLLLAEVSNGEYTVIKRKRVAVRIGQGGISEGIITEEAIQRALATLTEFKQHIEENLVEKVFATATSAVRSASNGKELADRILQSTGIEVRIISGDEEAESIYFGVCKAMDLGNEASLIMDVGGGSIEFVIANAEEVFWKRSFEMGGQRLLDRFHKSDPIDSEELQLLNEFIEHNLSPLMEAVEKYSPRTLVGSSGTFDTLSDIYCKKEGIEVDKQSTEFPLTVDGFMSIFEDLKAMNRAERLKIPGMIEMRVDMIVVASVLVNYIIEAMSMEKIRVSAYALKEGILMQIISDL